jgi:hypothetical protein
MDSFSFGQALGAGFRVIGRKPLAVVIWAAVYLLLVALPALALAAFVLPQTVAAYQQMAVHVGPPDPAQMMALRSRTFGLQPAIWLLSVVANTVVIAAIFRAVLEPGNSRWGYLRLSGRELWLGLTYLVILVMSLIMIFVLALPIGIGAAVVAAVGEHGGATGGGAVLLALVGLVGAGVIVWVLLRLSMALPMSFAQGRFLLYESWEVTRGHALKIFLVFLVLWIALAVVEAALVSAVAFHFIPLFRQGTAWQTFTAASLTDTLRRLGPVIAGFVIVGSVVGMAVHAILFAPLAEIYRELTAEAPPAAS